MVQATTNSSQDYCSGLFIPVPFGTIFNLRSCENLRWLNNKLCSKPYPRSTFYPEKKPNFLQKALCVRALGTSPISFLSTLLLGLSTWPHWPRCCSTNIPQGLCTGSSPHPTPTRVLRSEYPHSSAHRSPSPRCSPTSVS